MREEDLRNPASAIASGCVVRLAMFRTMRKRRSYADGPEIEIDDWLRRAKTLVAFY